MPGLVPEASLFYNQLHIVFGSHWCRRPGSDWTAGDDIWVSGDGGHMVGARPRPASPL